MPSAVVLGGGLAGLSAAAALGGSGFQVDVFEARPFLGGRAASYTLPDGSVVDNCQHILMRCCTNLLDFYRRLGVSQSVRFHPEVRFLEPGGRMSVLRAGRLPAPLHFTASFLALKFLSPADKLGIARALAALRRERRTRGDLDRITMLEWLREKRQSPRAIERFWRQVLVSAVNEELDRMAAVHGFQVFWLGFLARADAHEVGVPAVPLGDLYRPDRWSAMPNVRFHLRAPVEEIRVEAGAVAGVRAGSDLAAGDFYVSALPGERLRPLAGSIELSLPDVEHSPITGIHLWFDRRVTTLPLAALLDRSIQWFFDKGEGKYLLVVVSASRSLLAAPRDEVIATAVRELAEFLPAVRTARLEKAHVVKEAFATFSASPDFERRRPGTRTRLRNLFLAGDWTRSGWPATMEGAVRSGYIAAEAVAAAAGRPARFLLPDLG